MNRLHRVLLGLYPREFRERMGPAMLETLCEEYAAARGRSTLAAVALVARTLLRIPFLALAEHARYAVDGAGTGGWSTDVVQAFRGLARSPGFALVTALTVGLGVGATVALYSVVDEMLLAPLPVLEPDGLYRVQENRSRYLSVGMEGPRLPLARYERLRDGLTGPVFTGLVGVNNRSLPMRSDGPAFTATVVLTTGNYFDVLGLRPAVGRFFSTDDEPTVVLGHRMWLSRFGGSTDVIGRTVHLGGRPFTVTGVAPTDFASTVGFLYADAWAPIGAHDGAAWQGARVAMFGRLAEGVTRPAAEERTAAFVVGLPDDDDPQAEILGARLDPLTPTPPSMTGPLGGFLAMLFATAALVLLIAGANVAAMLVARTARRGRELAVRLALGIGRARLVRQSLIETVALFTLGGWLGTGIAVLATGALSRLRLPTAEPVAIVVTPTVGALGFGLGVAILTGVLFGWMPALYASRTEPGLVLQDGARGSSGSGSRARSVFVTVQLALSVVLLVAATLFVRTAHRGMSVDPGFTAERVVVARIDLSPHGYDEVEGRLFFDRLLERVRARPGVESASLADLAMLTGESSNFGGWRLAPDDAPLQAGQNVVDGHYFETLEIDLVSGRAIGVEDVEGGPPVLVVNESFARRFWPGESPLGKSVLRGSEAHEVVGLVRDGAYVDFGRAVEPFTFLAATQRYSPQRTLHLRHRPGADPAEVIASLRREVQALDQDVAVEQPVRLTDAIGTLLFPQRFAAALIGAFGLLGLFLAATGIYGLLAHHVVQRTREYGIRIALGAEASELLGLVLRRGALLMLVGTVTGLGIAAAVSRLLAGLLHGISPYDTVAFVGVPILLAVVALIASTLPAARVLRLDPVEALRQD